MFTQESYYIIGEMNKVVYGRILQKSNVYMLDVLPVLMYILPKKYFETEEFIDHAIYTLCCLNSTSYTQHII